MSLEQVFWPVTIVVPHQKSRAEFFTNYTLPSILANNPAEIFVEDWEGGAPEKRNAGAFKASQPYILFVDDDTILSKECLPKMVKYLENNQKAGYAYSNYVGFVWPGIEHPQGASYLMQSRSFDAADLRKGNYIDTTSLIRRSAFPRFDPTIRRLQDWDLWLNFLRYDIFGGFIDEVLFMKYTIDRGISATVPADEAERVIREKHRI